MNVTGPQSMRSAQISAKRAPTLLRLLADDRARRAAERRDDAQGRRARRLVVHRARRGPPRCSESQLISLGSSRCVLGLRLLQCLDCLEALKFRMTEMQGL